MYLFRTEKCEDCNLCLDFCHVSKNPKIQNCRQCPDAPCMEACKYDAFYEVSEGVLAINPELCTGCGDCANACPYDAIVMEGGIAKKCDLCGECVSHCPLNALKLVETEKEKEEKEAILGWKKTNGTVKIGVYNPSIQEAHLIEKFLRLHREVAKTEYVKLDELLDEFTSASRIELEKSQREGLLGIIKSELDGFSILDGLLKNEDIEEISVTRGSPIRVFIRGGSWEDTDITITSEEKIIEIANKMAYSLNRRLTSQEPRMNANLPDGSRLHAIIPPIAHEATLTIRKFKPNPFSPKELIDNKTITAEALAYLWIAIQLDTNILIAGSTGSGKTTTLNTALAFIPKNQRVITIEETPELVVHHPHKIRLVVNKERDITMGELVKDTLRMRPDKVIVGEIRSKDEISAWIDTTLAGQGKGSLATFHALTSREAINRLRSKGVSETDLSGVNLILVQRRWTDKLGRENRKVFELTEVSWDNGIALTPIYKFDLKKSVLTRTRHKSRILSTAGEIIGINTRSEIIRRAQFLRGLPSRFEDAFSRINEWVVK